MLVFAVVGLIAIIAGLFVLRSGAKDSLNVKGAYLEVLGGQPRRARGRSTPVAPEVRGVAARVSGVQ